VSSHFTTPLALTSQFSFCGMPLRLDSYAGCAFQCSYCFARYRGGQTFGERVRPADPKTLGRTFKRALDTHRSSVGVIGQFLRRRVPIHFGGMSDPFQPAELRYGITEQFLRTLARYHYPTVISTRGTLPALDRFAFLLEELGPVVIQFSFSTTIDAVARRLEPYANPPSKLLRTMESLSKRGLPVTSRWQPYIPGVSESPQEFVPRMAATGCRHVSFEHLKLPYERSNPLWPTLSRGIGPNVIAAYHAAGARKDGREYTLPQPQKFQRAIEVARIVRTKGMTFGSADNDLQYLSDTPCCCSGVDQFSGFENYFKHQIAYAVRKSRGGEIKYGTIAREWTPSGSIDRFLNSRSRLSSRLGIEGSLRDHIVRRWNDPVIAGGPASFYGVTSNGTTTAGHQQYEWSDELRAYWHSRP
jgi:DNA repair photolyase